MTGDRRGPRRPPGRPREVWLRLALWAALLLALRLVAAPAEARDPPAPGELRAAVREASAWLQRAQAGGPADGRYLYAYDAARDRVPGGYNEVRHAGVTMALYQAAGRERDPAALAAADRAAAWMTARLHRPADPAERWAALTGGAGARAKTGGTALMVAALAERRIATGDGRRDALMRELGAFLARMQRPDGGFHVAWRVGAGEPDREGVSRFYPGEALWAFALLHEAFPGEGWDARARAASRFVTTRRDGLEGVRFPPLADHWAAYGLAEMAEWGLADHEIAYARRLAARFGFLVRVESQRGNALLGGPARLVRSEVRAAAFGTWVEGLAALWRLAAADPRMADLRPAIRERLATASALLARRRADAAAARDYARPGLVRGAWLTAGETRMDDQQHALSGLLYAADALAGRTRRGPDRPLPVAP